jgi:hypothetical protein
METSGSMEHKETIVFGRPFIKSLLFSLKVSTNQEFMELKYVFGAKFQMKIRYKIIFGLEPQLLVRRFGVKK